MNTLADSAESRYKEELAAAGMEDGPPSALMSIDRLKCILEYQLAWRELEWRSEKLVPMLPGGVWELYGGILAQAKDRQTLVFRQLPSEIRGIEEKQWEGNIGVMIRDFGMDPSQDLLAVIENPSGNGIHRVHLRTLSSGQPHPKACNPAVISHAPDGENFSFAIQIADEYLAILFIASGEDSRSELIVWNWRTGNVEMAIHGKELASFSFLTDRQILLAYIEIAFDELAPTFTEPYFMVVDFKAGSPESTHIRDLDFEAAFHYPPMMPSATPLAVSIRSDPAPSWKPNEDLKVPFHAARDERLFVITFWVAADVNISNLIMFIPSSTIVSRLRTLQTNEKGRRFYWDEWGPTGTRLRFAPPGHSMVWVCYVLGMAFIAPFRSSRALHPPRGPKMVQVFDFNQLAIKRALSRKEEEPQSEVTHIITEESTVSLGGVFVHDVHTSLPYRWRVKTVPVHPEHTFDAVMLGEDAIVTVTSRAEVREYRILSF
ncbi:hypothetical protein EW026_g6612 [Hermanssonia centrifuga]|uniref:Uncharacterized protein n=1 Tax=Hermanssonia centrifuga TaxID=98765 RepID=A0A4S4KBF2_9APHY|nr:hypothetical protein EW026_g6612 [Hermanssonia centrifuga]